MTDDDKTVGCIDVVHKEMSREPDMALGHAALDRNGRSSLEELCETAYRHPGTNPPQHDLAQWARGLTAYLTTRRALAAALALDDPATSALRDQLIDPAAAHLVRQAQATGAVRQPVSAHDLTKLVYGIALAVGGDIDAQATADRLLSVALHGIHGPVTAQDHRTERPVRAPASPLSTAGTGGRS